MRAVAIRLVNQLVALDRALTSLSLVIPENPDFDERWKFLQETWADVAESQRDLRNALEKEGIHA